MNSVSNSDSETVHLVQNWVGCIGAHPTDHGYAHGAPKPRAHCVVLWRVVYRVAGPAPAVSQVCRAPAQRCRGLSRDTPSGQAACCVATHKAAPLAAIQFVSQLSLSSPRSCHDTNDCIVTHLSGQAALLSRYN